MKKIDELLNDLNVYEIIDKDFNITEESITDEEKTRIKMLALNKSGLNNKKLTKRKLILPLAAAMTLILSFAVVFAQGGLSKIYYDLFGENIKYVSGLGTEINESYSNNGVTLNVANMLGDENSFYIIFELINENGESFKKSDYIDLENFNLNFGGSGGYSWYKVEDDDENDNKATFLLIGNTAKKSINKKMSIKIKDLTEYSFITPENLIDPYDFLSKNKDYINQNLIENIKKTTVPINDNMSEEEKTKTEYANNLIPDEILPYKYLKINVGDKNNDFYIDNIGFAEGKLCIRFALTNYQNNYPDEFYFEKKNDTDGNNDNDNIYGEFLLSEKKDGIQYDYYKFNINNMEQLKNYVFKYHTVKESKKTTGEWNVSFKAHYKNSTKTINVNEETEIGGKRYTVENVKISPISLNINLKNNLIDNIEDPKHNLGNAVTVIMKDKSTVKLISSGTSTNSFSASINLIFEKPIDISLIDYVKISDMKINIK